LVRPWFVESKFIFNKILLKIALFISSTTLRSYLLHSSDSFHDYVLYFTLFYAIAELPFAKIENLQPIRFGLQILPIAGIDHLPLSQELPPANLLSRNLNSRVREFRQPICTPSVAE